MKRSDKSISKTNGGPESRLQHLSPIWVNGRKAPDPLAGTSLVRLLRAGVYLRYSTDRQDPYSFTRQLEKAKAYAKAIGAEIVKVYGDPAQSGSFTANRPGFKEMIADGKRKFFDAAIFEEGDRLSRRLHITAGAFSVLADHGVEIHSSKHGKWSLMHAAFSGLMSEEQRTRMVDLMRSGRVKLVEQGLWPARAPYGYEKISGQPGEMRVRQDTAEVVKRIFAMRHKGLTPHQIANVLSEDGIAPPKKTWQAGCIRHILQNPIYVGSIVFFTTEQKNVQVDDNTIEHRLAKRPVNEWCTSERSDWVIVELDVWRSVQELEATKREYGPTPTFLLSQLVYCGECGRKMHIAAHNGGRQVLRCSSITQARYRRQEPDERCNSVAVPLDVLEDEAIRFVCDRLDTPTALKQMQDAYDMKAKKEADGLNRDRIKLQDERDAILKRLDATFDAVMTIGLTTEAVRIQREGYCDKLAEIDQELSAIPQIAIAKTAFLATPPDSASFLSDLTPMRDYRECSEELAQLVNVFRRLVEKVVVKNSAQDDGVLVEIAGPVAHVQGEPTFSIRKQSAQKRRFRNFRELADRDLFGLTEADWKKIGEQFPVAPIWIEEFDTPVEFRRVLESIIFLRHARVGMANLPETFGSKRQIWAASRMVHHAGVLDELQAFMEQEGMKVIQGITLSFGSIKSKAVDPWGRFNDGNRRRKQRVLARLNEDKDAPEAA